MSQLLSDQRTFLELLVKASLKQQKALLQTLSDLQLKALSEFVHNLLKGNVPLSNEQKKTLKKYRSMLYILGDKKRKPTEKKKAVLRGSNPIRLVLKIALEHVPWLPNRS